MVVDGRMSKSFVDVRRELEPVGSKVPRGFTTEEWGLLSYEEKLGFVRDKKAAVLSGLQSKLSSPVVSLICDLQDLESKMFGQDVRDGGELSDTYMQALKLKIELAKAIKVLLDKGVVKHEHVVRHVRDDEVFDVDFDRVVKEGVVDVEGED
jgi:hypothetical protein